MIRGKALPSAVTAALVALALAGPARAQDEAPAGEAAPAGDAAAAEVDSGVDEAINLTLQDRIKAVSRKVFLKAGRFELAPQGGLSVNDAFFRRWALGGRAAWYITDSLALDFGGAYTIDEKLPPVEVLRDQQLAVPDENLLFGYADIGANFTPIYGKVALLSEWIVHFDAFVTGGVGATFDSSPNPLIPDLPVGFHPAFEVGAGARVFLTRWLVVRTDLRDYIYPQDRSGISKLQNLMMLTVGVGFFFPFDFEYKYEASKVVG